MASNPLLKFKNEILDLVVYPKLVKILHDQGNISVEKLHKNFREKHKCTVSIREFKEWCNDMHLKCETVTAWNLKPVTNLPENKFNGIEEKAYDQFLNNDKNRLFIDIPPATDPEVDFDNI